MIIKNQSQARMLDKNVGKTHENSANILEPKSVPCALNSSVFSQIETNTFTFQFTRVDPVSKKFDDMIGWYIANIFMVIQ